MDDRWMRALLRPLDLLAFLSMTPPSDARTPHPGRVPPARHPIPGRASDGDWTVPAGRVRRRPAPGDNGPPARELAEGPRPGAAGNGEKKNEHIGE